MDEVLTVNVETACSLSKDVDLRHSAHEQSRGPEALCACALAHAFKYAPS